MRRLGHPAAPVRVACAAILLGLAGYLAPAGEFSLAEAWSEPPPCEGLGEAEALRVKEGASPYLDLWVARAVRASLEDSGELGVAFGRLPNGLLVGCLRLHREWRDYRGASIPAGSYRLAYAVQPADGNHMGVSYYRDFLVLLPADETAGAGGTVSADRLLQASRQVSGTTHPAVMALFPVSEEGETPRFEENDMGQPMVGIPLGPYTVGVVIQGQGEVEGY